MPIYRSVRPNYVNPGELRKAIDTSRPPGNVPYLVDNLWEWMRPEGFPCRRKAVFASPTPELACQSGPAGAHVYEVEFAGKFIAAQLVKSEDSNFPKDSKFPEDSKFHPECRNLRRLLLKELGPDWVGAGMDKKALPGRLWIPCLSAAEVQLILDICEQMGLWNAAEIANAVRYWDTVQQIEDPNNLPDPRGEVFFIPTDGYRLHEVG